MSSWSPEMEEALDWPMLLRARGRSSPGESVAGRWQEEAAGTEAADEALIRRVARGSARAFEILLDRYRDRIFQFVLWQLDGGRDLAEELTQEIFFQLYRSARTFRHRSRFRTWLYSLARNVCRQHQRRHRCESGRVSWGEEGEAPVVVDGRPGALERLAAAEAQARVREAVASLPPLFRTVLVLRDWEELSYKEMAQVLAVPVGTVRSRLHNARSALAAALMDGEEAPSGG